MVLFGYQCVNTCVSDGIFDLLVQLLHFTLYFSFYNLVQPVLIVSDRKKSCWTTELVR